uniref:Lipase n=1 Tax=Strigamia maritima TaxID=126957 RepID=T1J802_STRMM
MKEATMSIADLITENGYSGETHTVSTNDGYKLILHRIPFGKNKPQEPGVPVLIMHSAFCGSSSWLDNLEDSLGYILADEGFDVWLGNVRGNEGSEHISYGRDDAEFWDFSWEEIAEKDLTALIDYVRNVTKYEKVLYIGESLGTLIGFALFSSPEYDNKVAGFVAMSPILNAKYVTTISGKILVNNFNKIQFISNIFGSSQVRLYPERLKTIIATFCTHPTLCNFFYTIITGYSPNLYNVSRFPVYTFHCSESVSAKTLRHGHQLHSSQILAKYDYGKTKNLEKYGSITPPIYNTSKITTPIALITSANDPYATPINAQLTARNLTNVIAFEIVPEILFNHVNFMWSHPAKPLIYDRTIEILKQMWSQNGLK